MRSIRNVASVLILLLLTTAALAERPYCGKIIEVTSEVELIDGQPATVCYVGSFVIVSDDLVLTNWHNIRDLEEDEEGFIVLEFADSSKRPGFVVDSIAKYDLALVKFPGGLKKPLHRIKVGAEDPSGYVTVGGYPGGGEYVEKVVPFTANINDKHFVMEGIFRTGFSGSPVINSEGSLVGLLWGSDFGPDNPTGFYFGYATRIKHIRDFLQKNDILFD